MSTLLHDSSASRAARTLRRDNQQGIRAALAALSEPSLYALRCVALDPTPVAPGLMLWIEHATAWELDRRARRRYALHEPLDAIHAEQVFPGILALAALSRRFGTAHPEVDAFFRAVGASLAASRVMH